MAVLMIVELSGLTEELMTASARVEQGLGMPDGLLVRAVAPTDDGIVLVNLWASERQRLAANEDPAHRDVLAASGLAELARERRVRRIETARVEFGAR